MSSRFKLPNNSSDLILSVDKFLQKLVSLIKWMDGFLKVTLKENFGLRSMENVDFRYIVSLTLLHKNKDYFARKC